MRASIWTAALGLAVCLASNASAQQITSLSAGNNAPPSPPGVSIGTYLLNTFSLTNLFSSYQMTARTQTPGSSGIPDPNSPAYLQAFGFQRLTH